MQLTRGQVLEYWMGADEPPIECALRDLSADLERVLAARLQRVARPDRGAGLVLVNLKQQSWPGLKISKGGWERYEIALHDGRIVIAGSDTRGLVFGIYQFSQHALGVDPLHFWIPRKPEARQSVDPARAVTVSPSPTFKYRGWFVNDEDLLERWRYGTRRETPAWRTLEIHKSISLETYERLFELMLRLRVNLVIPATATDISRPEVLQVFERIRRRGLLFSQHHIEPVGVCPGYAFVEYCRREGIESDFSWTNNREVVEACWRQYIDRIARFGDSVVWQLGYRGRDDIPFWVSEPNAPADMAGRARIISAAIARQYELIRERVGASTDIVCTTTLWWEGNLLYEQNLLQLPEEVIVVISDVARTQTLPDPLPARHAGTRYGVYYHSAYWSTGPHLIQGNPVSNVFANYSRALEAGAVTYTVHNVSNVRPFLPTVQAVADLTFERGAFDESIYMGDFCERHFGRRSVAQLYDRYFAAFVHHQEPDLRKRYGRWLDGSLAMIARAVFMFIDEFGAPTAEAFEAFMRCVAFRLFLLRDNAAVTGDYADDKNPESWRFHDWKALRDHATKLLAPSLERWRALIEAVEATRCELEKGKALYDSNLYWQALLGYGLTLSALQSLEGVASWVDGHLERAANHFDEAARELDDVLGQGPRLAEQEHFRGWTGCDLWLGVPQLRDQHRRTAAKLKERMGHAPFRPRGEKT